MTPNSGPRASIGERPPVTRSGNQATTVHDLAIAQLDGNGGLMSLTGRKKNRASRLSRM